MKINKDTRKAARKIFRECLKEGVLDETRLRTAVSALAEKQPRNYLGMLSEMEKLTRLDVLRRTVTLESATALPEDQIRKIETTLQNRHSNSLFIRSKIKPALLGGLRIQMGSDVWDGSVSARLDQLKKQN